MQSANHIPLFVSCSTDSGPLLCKAKQLAQSLNLPFLSSNTIAQGYILLQTDSHLELHEILSQGRFSGSPLVIDFVTGKNGYRRRHNTTIHQPLARAVGIKPGFRPTIVDGTAGLGRDGFVLACLGCNVILVERSKVLGALLRDGLHRGLKDEAVGQIISKRLILMVTDTKEVLKELPSRPHSIYLDPMYPKREKSALNKKEMRILRALVGDDQDGSSLLECALDHAANRVVVKRPKLAPLLGKRRPSFQITMSSSRFDIYLI